MATEIPAKDKKEAEPERFPTADMIAHSSGLFGHPSHVMAGALHGYRNVTITKEEAEERLDAFLTREVS